jgi:hypothetical protein
VREKIFRWVLRNHPEGCMLTKPQMITRCVLFPVQWVIQKNSAYDPLRDIWNIHGKKYTGKALYNLANANGEAFKVSQINGCTTLERIDT